MSGAGPATHGSYTYPIHADDDVNAFFGGGKWVGTGAGNKDIYFSFPDAASNYGAFYTETTGNYSFVAMTNTQKDYCRAWFAEWEARCGINFVEMTETDSSHADIRVGITTYQGTAWAYQPGASSAAGDVWLSTKYFKLPGGSVYASEVWTPGTYQWMAGMHEIGHAIGAKHAHETYAPSWPAATSPHDWSGEMIMSYKAYAGAGAGANNGMGNFPQTVGMYDEAATSDSDVWGPNATILDGDTEISFSVSTGQMLVNGVAYGPYAPYANRIYRAMFDCDPTDDNGFDLGNINYGHNINLNAGEWSIISGSQLASLSPGVNAPGNFSMPYASEPYRYVAINNSTSTTTVFAAARNDNRLIVEGGEGDYAYDFTGRDGTIIGYGVTHTVANCDYVQFATGGPVPVAELTGGGGGPVEWSGLAHCVGA